MALTSIAFGDAAFEALVAHESPRLHAIARRLLWNDATYASFKQLPMWIAPQGDEP